MEMRPLGQSGLQVSSMCLGTMSWGEQNTTAEAHEQLDYCFEKGLNFIDTAEMYPVPPQKQTYGQTEKIIGEWFKAKKNRDKVILASKVIGRSRLGNFAYVRDGNLLHDRKNIEDALNASLKRLQTDYIDLYQLHWPERSSNIFGKRSYVHDPKEDIRPIEDILEVLNDQVLRGKIRCVGVSNESPWGLMEFLKMSEKNHWTRIASIQNPYNLLNRSFEIGHAEIACREQCGLLAYSPLAFGVLSGKYLFGQRPKGARLTKWKHYNRYSKPSAEAACEKYLQLAKYCQLDPAQMALAFCRQQSFVTSVIFGGTSLKHIEMNVASSDLKLSEDVIDAIDSIYEEFPHPCP